MRRILSLLIVFFAVVPVHADIVGFADLLRPPIAPFDGWFPGGDISNDVLVIHQAYTFSGPGIITAVNALDDSDSTSEDLQLLTFSFNPTTEVYTVTNIVSMPDDTASWVGADGGIKTFTLNTPINVGAGDFFGHFGTGGTHAIPFESLHGNPAGSSFLSFIADPNVGSMYAKASLQQNRDYHINVSFTVVPLPAAAWLALPIMIGVGIAQRRK